MLIYSYTRIQHDQLNNVRLICLINASGRPIDPIVYFVSSALCVLLRGMLLPVVVSPVPPARPSARRVNGAGSPDQRIATSYIFSTSSAFISKPQFTQSSNVLLPISRIRMRMLLHSVPSTSDCQVARSFVTCRQCYNVTMSPARLFSINFRFLQS